MRSRLSILLLLLSATVFAEPATLPDFPTLYRDYEEAVRLKDTDAYLRFFTPDCSMTTQDGKTHDRAWIAEVWSLTTRQTKTVNDYRISVQSVTPMANGEVAVVVLQRFDRELMVSGRKGAIRSIKSNTVKRDIWRKTSQGWKIKNVREILVTTHLRDARHDWI